MARFRELAAAQPASLHPCRRRQIAGLGAIVAAWAGLLTGCTVGPDYVPPKPVMPAGFTEQIGSTTHAAQGAQTSNDAWWEGFNDATLNSLLTHPLQSAPAPPLAEAHARE